MPVVTIRDLNSIGNVGNQLFAYVFAKAYALKHGAELQVPEWFGRALFVNATEPLVTAQFPQTECDSKASRPMDRWFGKVDIDIRVYAQHQVYIDYYTRAQCREWLKFKPTWEVYSPSAQGRAPYSAAHLRREDYTSEDYIKSYCVVSRPSYDLAIKQFGIPKPVIPVFNEMNPMPEDWPAPGFNWLPNFLLLRDAAHLLRGNSSFSWWAATLGNGKVHSPVVGKKVGWNDVEFVEGNWPTTAGIFSNQSDLRLKE